MRSLTVFLLMAAVVAVKGQNPTSVCYPQAYMSSYFDLMTQDTGAIYVDLTAERYAEVSSVTGNRFLHDFANLKSYAISGEVNHTTCHSFKLLPNQIMYRCLPPYAKNVEDASGYFSQTNELVGNPVQTWEIETEYDTIFRIVFSSLAGYPFVPIFSQQFGYHGTTQMFLYTNHSFVFNDPTMLDIPDSCV